MTRTRMTLEEKLARAEAKEAEAVAARDALAQSPEIVAAQAACEQAYERYLALRSKLQTHRQALVRARLGTTPGTAAYATTVHKLALDWLGLTAADYAANATMHGSIDLLANSTSALSSALVGKLTDADATTKKLVQQVEAANAAWSQLDIAMRVVDRPLRSAKSAASFARMSVHDLENKIQLRDKRGRAEKRTSAPTDAAREPTKAKRAIHREARKRLRAISGTRRFASRTTAATEIEAQLADFGAFVEKTVPK